jgi:hypothetical protein
MTVARRAGRRTLRGSSSSSAERVGDGVRGVKEGVKDCGIL